MSVMIEGMEMPKSCKTCSLGCIGAMVYYPLADSRNPNCPLVEVVRCKDCKNFAGEGMYCANDIIVQFDHFYCYYGERRSE